MRLKDFQPELLDLLDKHGIPDAPEFVWMLKEHLEMKNRGFGTLCVTYHGKKVIRFKYEQEVKGDFTDRNNLPF